jgi:hypothetical protein
MEQFMQWMHDNWLWIVSFVTVVGGLVVYVYSHIKALQMGVQALLRAQMIEYYNHYRAKGYAPLYARESFENCWIQYEKLGKNGVMANIRAKFLALPTHDDEHD